MYDKPDYSKYTLNELRDVLDNVDREQYRDRYLEVLEILEDPETLAKLTVEQARLDEESEQAKAEDRSYIAPLILIISGWSFLFFGVLYSRYGGFIELGSPLERNILGGFYSWQVYFFV